MGTFRASACMLDEQNPTLSLRLSSRLTVGVPHFQGKTAASASLGLREREEFRADNVGDISKLHRGRTASLSGGRGRPQGSSAENSVNKKWSRDTSENGTSIRSYSRKVSGHSLLFIRVVPVACSKSFRTPKLCASFSLKQLKWNFTSHAREDGRPTAVPEPTFTLFSANVFKILTVEEKPNSS